MEFELGTSALVDAGKYTLAIIVYLFDDLTYIFVFRLLYRPPLLSLDGKLGCRQGWVKNRTVQKNLF